MTNGADNQSSENSHEKDTIKKKQKKRTPITQRKFNWDAVTQSYFIEPSIDESIKLLGATLRRSACLKNMSSHIFEHIKNEKREYFKISKEDYDEWKLKVHKRAKVIHCTKREFVTIDDDTIQIKLKKNEAALSVYAGFRRHFLDHNLKDLANELSINSDRNTISITPKGKKDWDDHLLSLETRKKSRKKSPIVRNKRKPLAVKPLKSQYQRKFFENDTHFWTQPRKGEMFKHVLDNLNQHASSKLKKKIFQRENDKIIVKKVHYFKWKSFQNTTSPATKKLKKISTTPKFISTKYLENTDPIVFTKSQAEKSPNEISGTVLKFTPLHSLLTEKSVETSQRKFELENAGFHFEIKTMFHKGEFTLNKQKNHLIFVRAGRKLNANIPCFESNPNCTIMLIMSSAEFSEACIEKPKFYTHLPNNVQLLIIQKCKAPTDQEEMTPEILRSSNIKRKVALLVANHFSIKDYVMLDDNIESFSVSDNLSKSITPNVLFKLFEKTRELPEYQNKLKPLCITAGTYAPHKNIQDPLTANTLEALDPCFGSKLMYINSENVIAKAQLKKIPLLELCSFRDLNWGEDYFWQFALGDLTEDDHSVLGRLPYHVAFLERKVVNKNSTLALPQFKLANEWIRSFEAIQNEPSLSSFQKRIANKMKETVLAEIERRKKLQETLEPHSESESNEVEISEISPQSEPSNNILQDCPASQSETDDTEAQNIHHTEKFDDQTRNLLIFSPTLLTWKEFKVKEQGAAAGEIIANTGFDLNLKKLNAAADKRTSNPNDKAIFIKAAQEAHHKKYSVMSLKERAVAKGKYHGEIHSKQSKLRIDKEKLSRFAETMGEYKDIYLDSFYATVSSHIKTTYGQGNKAKY